MKRFIPLLVVLLATNACAFGKKAPTPEPSPSMTASPVPVPSPATPSLNIQFTPVKNYTKSELAVLAVSEVLANETVQSACFSNFMLSRKMIQTNGKTNAEVVNQIQTAKLVVPVTMYYSSKKVVGYRSPPNPTVYTNRKYHGVNSGYTLRTKAANLTHEWSHVLGYGHDYKQTTRRPYSVPYSINAAFTACVVCNTLNDCYVKE